MELIATGEIESLTANEEDHLDFVLPSGFASWSLLVVPRHVGGGTPDSPDARLQYFVGGTYYDVNAETPVAAAPNEVCAYSRSDLIPRIRLILDNGASPPDNGAVAQLFGVRRN